MDTLGNVWNSFLQLVDSILGAVAHYVTIPYFIVGVIVLAGSIWAMRRGTVWTTIGLIFGAGALYAVLLSIKPIPGHWAFIIVVFWVTVWLWLSVSTPKKRLGKGIFIILAIIFTLVTLYLLSAELPNLQFGENVRHALSSTTDFWRKLLSIVPSALTPS